MYEELKITIENAWEDRNLLKDEVVKTAINKVIDLLDKGLVRVAEPNGNAWKLNEWIKKAVILYFPISKMKKTQVGPFEFHDKISLKSNYKELGVRVVPHAVARYGCLSCKRSHFDAFVC